VRDRLEVDLVKSNEFVGKEVECPARLTFWRFATGEFDEVGFGIAIEFAFVLAVGLAAMNRREPSFTVGLACAIWCANTAPDVLTDLSICEPVVSLQENPCPCIIFGLSFTGRNEPLQRSPLLVREIDDVLLSAHSCRYALRDDKLVSTNLKLH
jgi:hypothetical protein